MHTGKDSGFDGERAADSKRSLTHAAHPCAFDTLASKSDPVVGD